MNDEREKIVVIQEPAPVQEIMFTISPMGPSMIERLKQNCEQAKLPEMPEGMSAASIIAMAADSWNLPLPSAFHSPSVMDQLQQQLEKARENGVKMIPVTSALGPSERLIDPG
ncbi:hypothetical protein B9G55_01380 [Saccharibacillus sp. O16]|nr:hypothetical protein B9G55_01380 [Saccharibacillus sp. O16]